MLDPRRITVMLAAIALLASALTPALAAAAEPGVIVYDRSPGTFPAPTEQHQTIAVTPDGETFTTLVERRPTNAAVSPNGRWLASTRSPSGIEVSELWLSRTDGSGARRLYGDGRTWVNRPAWSPDGRRLAFGLGDAYGQLRVHDVVTGTTRTVALPADVCTVLDLDWSPDGRWLAFHDACHTDPDVHVWVVRDDGTGARSLTGTRGTATGLTNASPAWSPDGDWIAFARGSASSPSREELWVVQPDGGGLRRVAGHAQDSFGTPAWSPDGTELAFSRWTPGPGASGRSVWRVRLDGTGLTSVTQPPAPVQHEVRDWRVLASSTATACPAGRVPSSGFPDVAGTHAAAVDCAVWHALAQGREDGTYAPAAAVRRDQVASLLARLLTRAGVALPEPSDQGFDDIGGNHHAAAINQLAELGILNGLTETTYGPARPMTRAQMATLLVNTYERAAGSSLPRLLDEFADDQGTHHEHAIDRAANAGFVRGVSVSRYAPAGHVRRDQMASFLVRVVDRLVVEGRVTLPS